MNKSSYATFGLRRSWMQIRHALDDRRNAERNMSALFQLVLCAESRMAARLGRPVESLRILEIGPGQGLERARYFGIKNEVIGLDLDVIPVQKRTQDYYRVFRQNGFGRLAKTIGREVIVGKANEHGWSKAVGTDAMRLPEVIQGDICGSLPALGKYDLIMSWSVFEHLADPKIALENVIHLLNPGGLFYLSIHLYTANNGHHDIRAFTGQENRLPLWGHLRASTRSLIHPSAYLNQWRLAQWRSLFGKLTPGYIELLERNDDCPYFIPRLTRDIRAELSEYTDEELFTVNSIYSWRKASYSGEAMDVS